MSFKPKSLILDSTSGYVDLGLGESQGDSNRAGFGQLDYGPTSGSWARDLRTLKQISLRWGIIVGLASHYEPETLNKVVGTKPDGTPKKDKEMIGWRLTLVGKGGEMAMRMFDEVYRLEPQANEVGNNPARKLYVSPHTLHDFEFPAKSRVGVNKGMPLMNPTWDAVVKAPRAEGFKAPTFVIVAGTPGAGKTTFFRTFPKPILVLDMLGGWHHFPDDPEIRVVSPTKLEQVFETLRQVRDKGEVA